MGIRFADVDTDVYRYLRLLAYVMLKQYREKENSG